VTGIPQISLADLANRYDALLLDAYGVLVNGDGALPGATDAVAELQARGVDYYVVTNDASRLPESMAQRFGELGFSIPVERMLSSGALLGDWFEQRGLAGRPTGVMGPAESQDNVRRAGGNPVDLSEPFEVLAVCDERGIDFEEAANTALSTAYRQLDAGLDLALVLPNPDLLYPGANASYCFTSGALALLLEQGLALRYPGRDELRFTALGKPHKPLFEAAMARAESRNVVMIGDQLATDIAGANAVGIDSALIDGGVSATPGRNDPQPTWRLPAFARSHAPDS